MNTQRILIVTSVTVEQEAVQCGLQADERFDVIVGGVGSAAAAASTAVALVKKPYELVLCMGIAGGFVGQAEIGSIVVADAVIAADLGAETAEGFCSVDTLGFGSATVSVDKGVANQLGEALHQVGLSAHVGPVLTLSTVTGTAETREQLVLRVPDAKAEAMEGYGVAIAAQQQGIPVMEIRAISNAIGPRDRSAWRIKDALIALEAAAKVIQEVL